jgi:hypothetical protein
MYRCLVFLVFLCCDGLAGSVSVVDFGAAGDGKSMNTAAIQKAIDRVAAGGGGTVSVPSGVFMTGVLRLRSNVELRIERGAVLKGSDRVEDYVLDGRRVGLLFTQDAENVSITGPGTIDGNGDAFMELKRAKRIENPGLRWARQKEHFREIAQGLDDGPVVPKERPFQMIIFSACKNVTVRDVLISNSPFWTLHFADCDGVVVSGTRIWCNLLVPNNDGVDFTSCSNVLMSDCDIRTGDDCIAITGYSHHHDLPGYKDLSHPCENIAIMNCLLISRSCGIRIGGFDQNPMRNFSFSNITITNSNRGIGLFVRDRGSIENLVFSNIVIETRLYSGDWWGNGEPIHLSAVRLTKDVPLGSIRNIKFQNMVCSGPAGMLVYGTSESVIEDVTFDGVRFHMKDSKLNDAAGGNIDLRPVLDPALELFAHDIPGFYAQHVKNLRIRDFDLTWDPLKQPFFTNGLEIKQFEGVRIEDFHGTGAPGNPAAFPVALEDGKGYEISGGSQKISTHNVTKD